MTVRRQTDASGCVDWNYLSDSDKSILSGFSIGEGRFIWDGVEYQGLVNVPKEYEEKLKKGL